MLKIFKNKIGFNLFALLGFLPIGFLIYDYLHYHFEFIGMGIFIYGLLQGCLISLSLLILIIELLCKNEIKNEFIQKNNIYNIYNIILIVGSISSSLCFLFFIYILIFGIIQRLGIY